MKILVAIKRVIDYNIKIRIKADGSAVETQNIKMSMNPFDEIAVEAALELKEKGIATEVIVVSIGDVSCEETLRTALAMGVDRAIRVDLAGVVEPLNVAKCLTKIVSQETPSMIILGKQAIDDDCNQTGQMLAGLLNWSQGTFVSQLKIKNDKVQVVREVDGGLETLELALPTVITTDLRLNTPRFISLPNIMKAKSKPLTVVSLLELGITLKSHVETVLLEKPTERTAGIKVQSISELMQKLKQEAGIL